MFSGSIDAVCLATNTTDFKFVTAKCQKYFLKPNHPECFTYNYEQTKYRQVIRKKIKDETFNKTGLRYTHN